MPRSRQRVKAGGAWSGMDTKQVSVRIGSRIAQASVVLVVLMTACAGNDAAPVASDELVDEAATGSYVRQGYPDDVLVLAGDGSFCLRQEGWSFGGTYEVDGGTLTMTTDDIGSVEETGTIEDGLIVDPGGERWTRSENAGACVASAEPEPADSEEAVAGSDALLDALADVAWPLTFDEAVAVLERLPHEVGGYEGGELKRSGGAEPVASVAFPDPTYEGPVSGAEFIVLSVFGGFTAAESVDVTAHLGFGLRGEVRRLGDAEEVPAVVGRIEVVEGAGELPADHPRYLAVWAPSRSSEVVYVVMAESPSARADAIGSLAIAAVGG